MSTHTVRNEDDLLEPIREAWAEVLAVDDVADVPLDRNFLEAGGNSLMLVLLWELLLPLSATGRLSMSDLFAHSTVRAQAGMLAAPVTGPGTVPPDAGDGARAGLAGRRAAAGREK